MQGKTVIVTGGGSGIGEAIAARFHAAGANVVIAGRNTEKLAASAARMASPHTVSSARVSWKEANVRDIDAVEALIAFATQKYGRLDVLVNNAGIGTLSPVADLSPEVWREIIETDLNSVFYGAKFAIPHLLKTHGCVLNIASICGVAADPGFSPYNAAKAGVINFTRSLALELAAQGVRANAISPGLIRTPPTSASPEALFSAWEACIPMQRAGTVEEVAGLALFLAGPDASYITGQNFVVDGGITSHTGQLDLLRYYREHGR